MIRVTQKLLLFLILVGTSQLRAKAWDSIYLDEALDGKVRVESMHWLQAESGGQESDLSESDFRELSAGSEFLLSPAQNIWFKFELTSFAPNQKIVIKHPAALAKSIQVMHVVDGKYLPFGRALPSLLSTNLFEPKMGTHTYFLKVDTDIFRLHLEFWSFDRYMNINQWDHFIFGAFFLLAGISLLSSLLFGRWFRENKFYLSALVTLSTILLFAGQSGIFRWLVPSDFFAAYSSKYFGLSLTLLVISLGIYLKMIIKMDLQNRVIGNFVFKVLLYGVILGGIAYAFGLVEYNARLNQTVILVLLLYAVSIPLVYRLPSKEVKLVSLSWLVFVVHVFIFQLYLRNHLPYSWYVARSMYLGIIFQNVVYIGVLLLVSRDLRLKEVETSLQLAISEESKVREIESKQAAQSLVHVLCHDLVNPLSVIVGNIAILKSSISKQLEPRITKIENACNGIESMIAVIRKQEEIRSGKLKLEPAPLSVSEAIEESIQLFEQKARKKRISLKVIGNLGDLEISADRTVLVYSILANVISNAIKFSDPTGEIRFRALQEEDSTIIEVQDFGEGIPQDILSNLFEASESTTRTGTSGEAGSGFGSLQVKKYTELFNGRVEVHSQVGENSGTTFRLIFPTIKKEAA